jgi:tRNA (Thr-GGU) A37 N-methylase
MQPFHGRVLALIGDGCDRFRRTAPGAKRQIRRRPRAHSARLLGLAATRTEARPNGLARQATS